MALTGIVRGLKTLFEKYEIKEGEAAQIPDFSALEKRYKDLSKKLGFDIVIPERAFVDVAIHWLVNSDGKSDGLLEVAKKWDERFSSVGSLVTLGYIASRRGDLEGEKAYMIKACLLGRKDPSQQWGQVWEDAKKYCK